MHFELKEIQETQFKYLLLKQLLIAFKVYESVFIHFLIFKSYSQMEVVFYMHEYKLPTILSQLSIKGSL